MSRGFAEEETHDVCKVCDYAIRNEECPGCGFSFESFSIKEHDAAIRRQTIAEFLIKLHEIMDEKEKEYGVACIESNCDTLTEIEEWMHEQVEGGAE